MTTKLLWFLASLVQVLTLAFGLVWWAVLWNRGIFFDTLTPEAIPWVLGFGAFQLIAWSLIVLTVLRTRKVTSLAVQGIVFTAAVGMLLGTMLYYFTPVVGIPLVLPFVLALFVLQCVLHRIQST